MTREEPLGAMVVVQPMTVPRSDETDRLSLSVLVGATSKRILIRPLLLMVVELEFTFWNLRRLIVSIWFARRLRSKVTEHESRVKRFLR